MEAQLATVPADLPEDIHAEILLRLPAKSVLRFRSVCKAWRRITTDPHFLAAHARLRPAGVLLCTYLNSTGCRNRPLGCAVDVALDLLLVSGEEAGRRRLVRYHKCETTTTDPLQWWPPHCLLLGSCDGVLLLEKEGGFYLLCNPVTRQWAELPRLSKHDYFSPTAVREYAFYFHAPSGEYRLLYRRRTSTGAQTWFILSTGAAEPRCVDTHAADGLAVSNLRNTATTPVALHDRLHWPPCRETMEMVAFDTLSEKFHVMAGPRIDTPTLMKLFAMDGQLVAANFGEKKHVDLWFLVDYGAGRWERRHQVAMPWGFFWSIWHWLYPPNLWTTGAASDGQGNVILRNRDSLSVYNVRTKTVRTVNSVGVSEHVFRESLVQHPGFQAKSSADLSLIQL